MFEPWDGSFKITEGNYFVYTDSEDGVAYYNGDDMVVTNNLTICLNGNKMVMVGGGIRLADGDSYSVTITNCYQGTATSIAEAEGDSATGMLIKEEGTPLFNRLTITAYTYKSWILLEGVDKGIGMIYALHGNQLGINGEVYDPTVNPSANVSYKKSYGQATSEKRQLEAKENIRYVDDYDEEVEEIFDEEESTYGVEAEAGATRGTETNLRNNLKNLSEIIDRLR